MSLNHLFAVHLYFPFLHFYPCWQVLFVFMLLYLGCFTTFGGEFHFDLATFTPYSVQMFLYTMSATWLWCYVYNLPASNLQPDVICWIVSHFSYLLMVHAVQEFVLPWWLLFLLFFFSGFCYLRYSLGKLSAGTIFLLYWCFIMDSGSDAH